MKQPIILVLFTNNSRPEGPKLLFTYKHEGRCVVPVFTDILASVSFTELMQNSSTQLATQVYADTDYEFLNNLFSCMPLLSDKSSPTEIPWLPQHVVSLNPTKSNMLNGAMSIDDFIILLQNNHQSQK